MLRIKYPKFLNCIKYIPKGSDICIIEAIESLAYGNSESKYLSTVLEQNGNDYQKLINIIIEKYDLQVVVKIINTLQIMKKIPRRKKEKGN